MVVEVVVLGGQAIQNHKEAKEAAAPAVGVVVEIALDLMVKVIPVAAAAEGLVVVMVVLELL